MIKGSSEWVISARAFNNIIIDYDASCCGCVSRCALIWYFLLEYIVFEIFPSTNIRLRT